MIAAKPVVFKPPLPTTCSRRTRVRHRQAKMPTLTRLASRHGLQNAVQQRGGAVTLRLTPPEMGTVRIQLQIQSGTVNAQFHTETESAQTDAQSAVRPASRCIGKSGSIGGSADGAYDAAHVAFTLPAGQPSQRQRAGQRRSAAKQPITQRGAHTRPISRAAAHRTRGNR